MKLVIRILIKRVTRFPIKRVTRVLIKRATSMKPSLFSHVILIPLKRGLKKHVYYHFKTMTSYYLAMYFYSLFLICIL